MRGAFGGGMMGEGSRVLLTFLVVGADCFLECCLFTLETFPLTLVVLSRGAGGDAALLLLEVAAAVGAEGEAAEREESARPIVSRSSSHKIYEYCDVQYKSINIFQLLIITMVNVRLHLNRDDAINILYYRIITL
jgi:hypothetical protein